MCGSRELRITSLIRIICAALRERNVGRFYDSLASVYDEVFTDHLLHIEKITELLAEKSSGKLGCKVLDLACGTGLLSTKLAGQGFQVTGLDISSRSLDVLRKKDSRVRAVCGNVEDLPFDDDEFDSVVCLGAWRHFDDPGRVVDEIYRVLTPDGDVVIGYFPPKPGAFLKNPSGLLGSLQQRSYEFFTSALGYVDRVDQKHENLTMQILANRFEDLKTVPSGDASHLLHAHSIKSTSS